MKHYILVILGFVLLFSTPAQAYEINDAGAKQLETLVSTLIDRQKATIGLSGGALETDGNITVEQADSYYAITLPPMVFRNAQGMQSKIGLIAINAIPTNNPDNWKMSIAIPTPILYSDKENNPVMRIDIGHQRMGGLWNGKLKNFSKLAARYSDLTFSNYKSKETLSVGQISVAYGIKKSTSDTNTTENLVDTLLNINYRDLKSSSRMPVYRDLLPHHLNINLNFKKLPLKELLDTGHTILQAKKGNTGATQIALLQAMMTIPQILSKAGTTLTLTDTSYGNENYNVDMNGGLKANPSSVIGATGELLVKTEGLKDIISTLKKRAQTSPTSTRNQINSVIQRLQILDSIAKKEGNAKICNFTLNEQAKILINGEEVNGFITQASQ